jgi:hypothetical protein
MESKIGFKFNEDKESKDFTLYLPSTCTYNEAKSSLISLFEYMVKLELEATRAQEETKKDQPATDVAAEIVETSVA